MADRANLNILLITAALLLDILSVPAPAVVFYVKADGTGDYPTIQAAIDAATDGDEVVLMPGTYTGDGNRDLNFKAKAITVRSVNPDDDACMRRTIIDPEGIGVIVRFINDEGPESVFEGFTIGAGDIYKSVRRGKPGFFEFSINARPTTRRLRNKTCRPISKLRPLSYDKSEPYPQDMDFPGHIPPAGLAWDGHNPFHQPANTTDYYGSGDVNNNGELTFADVQLVLDMADGTVPPVASADVDGDGDVDQADAALIDTAYEGGTLPGWWNELTTVAQRNHWVDRVMAIDRTDEHWYFTGFFICHHFSYQTFIHAAFLRGDLATESTEYDGGQTVFNVPIYYVTIEGPILHAINAILVGDDPLDFDNWRFIEPQNDLTAHAGDWNIPYNSDVTIELCNLYWNGEVMVEFHVEETGCTLTSSSDNLVTTRPAPPEQEPDNRPDLWNPRIVPVGDSGVILYEKMREDMSRTTDIHITDWPFVDLPEGTAITMDSQFSRLQDVTKAADGTLHLLLEGTDIFYRQTLFHGMYDPVQHQLNNVTHVVQELRLAASGRVAVTPSGDIHAFWFENMGHSGSYDLGIHWAIWTGESWQAPQKLVADMPQSVIADWISRYFARYVFDVEVLDGGHIILVYVEKQFPDLHIKQMIYNGSWSLPELIETTNWNYGARIIDICKGSDGSLHLAYVCGLNQQPGAYEEGRGDLYHRSFDGVSWSDPVVVDDSGGTCCPSLASGADDKMYMAWERKIGGNDVVCMYSKYDDGTWRAPRQLAARPGANVWYPKVSQLADGTVVVYWSSRSSDRVTIEMEVVEPTPPHAESETVITSLGVPLTISLNASDDGLPDPPAALTYILTALPSPGSLNDPQAGTIHTVPYTLANHGNQVVYTPNEDFLGSDEFTFKANDSGVPPYGGDSDIAVITIDVLECSDVTIGTGTSTWDYPMHTFFHDARTQVIYLADEIGAAGIITALALDVETLPGQTMNNWTIRMKHTPMSSYSTASLDADGWTIVYQADETVDSTGWCTFTFATPFEYNGTDNLMVDFCHDNESYTSSGACRSSITGSTRSAYAHDDSYYNDPLDWSGTTSPFVSGSTSIPNVRLNVCSLSDTMSTELSLDNLWMYQNLPSQANSYLTATASITNDPMDNNSYTYDWEFLLPDDVTVAPATIDGCGDADSFCTFAAPGCNEPEGLSDSGETFMVRVTVTGDDYGNTGEASAQFGIALLGDVNNDKVVNVADRSIINAFWRLGAAGPFTFTDCNINCDTAVNVADRSIANAVWRGVLGQNSVSQPCPFR